MRLEILHRYQNDAVFNNLVNHLVASVQDGTYTMTDTAFAIEAAKEIADADALLKATAPTAG